MDKESLLKVLGLGHFVGKNPSLDVHSPIDGALLAKVTLTTSQETQEAIHRALEAFEIWRSVPAPKRGMLMRLFADELRHHKEALGTLVTLENGKILQEGLGEVQEMIDIADFVVGLSRQLYGLTIASERPAHKMLETWHPLGPIGVISPFNFPVAVWCWNFALAIVCGDPVIWKPSEKTPLTALAVVSLFKRALSKFSEAPPSLLEIVIGGKDCALKLLESPHLPLISATGSTNMGRAIAPIVAQRFGRLILELGGNNGMILTPSADLSLALKAILFSAIGTAGQRCTSLRRLIIHESLLDTFLPKLQKHYQNIKIGDPLKDDTLVGPLIDEHAFEKMQQALQASQQQGGTIFGGERVLEEEYPRAYYVKPAIVIMPTQTDIVKTETFAPILYVISYKNFADALEMHNDVPQGLSSCIFTNDLREAELFLSSQGSDCGIANVNIGPSGAEIGGAFGGDKESGGGREAGSDCWKTYMRRATNTINFSSSLPLAQGIKFGENN